MGQCNKTSRVCTVTKYARLAFVIAVGVHILSINGRLNGVSEKTEQNRNGLIALQEDTLIKFLYIANGVNNLAREITEWAQTVEARLAKPTEETK